MFGIVWSGGEGLTTYQGRSSLCAFGLEETLAEPEAPCLQQTKQGPRFRYIITAEEQAKMRRLHAQGVSLSALGRRYLVDRDVIRRCLDPACPRAIRRAASAV